MSQNCVLVVEDDPSLREALCDTLELAGYKSAGVDSGESALSQLDAINPSMIVSDVQMPGMTGHALLKAVKRRYPHVPFLLITAYGKVTNAVQAMQDGAADYLMKPFEPSTLVKKVESYIGQATTDGGGPVAEDPNSLQLLELANRVAQSDATVLITGESGTGKEVMARYVHDQSKRAQKPFIAINCAAIPENMLEATLFGYEKGAFTGAYQATAGKFELAQNGTLLLDEISEMSLALQAKLLRVLQEREVERLGGKKAITLDVRVIATSNRNMIEEVQARRFREDLYYRLNVFPLHWLPLRNRPKDILPLALYLIEKHAKSAGCSIPTLTNAAEQKLLQHSWPGNAREMDNIIQRAMILINSDCIDSDEIQIENAIISVVQECKSEMPPGSLDNDLKNREHELILKTLTDLNGSRKDTATKLKISPRTLRYKLAKMRDMGFAV